MEIHNKVTEQINDLLKQDLQNSAGETTARETSGLTLAPLTCCALEDITRKWDYIADDIDALHKCVNMPSKLLEWSTRAATYRLCAQQVREILKGHNVKVSEQELETEQ